MMSHIALLGDSIFDNAAYVDGGPDVVTQLQQQLPEGWKATLKAIDGSVIPQIPGQLEAIPEDTTHLVISVGGNDALNNMNVITQSVESMAEALDKLAEISDEFEHKYHQMLQVVLNRNLPTILCTIYYPCFPDPTLQRLAVTALTNFNDCIIKQALLAGISLIDLRLVCNENEDYANPIEPSSRGGEKIANVIAKIIKEYDFTVKGTRIFF
jgi:lysophospholipase L1-like esterase